MSNKFNIAVAGATGNVGREIIQILEDKNFPVDQLFLLASSRSKGQTIEFRGEQLIVQDLAEFDFSKAHIGLFSPGGKVSGEYAPKAAKAGCLVTCVPGRTGTGSPLTRGRPQGGTRS